MYKTDEISSYPYVSSYTFRLACDHGWLSKGDIQYCKGDIYSNYNGVIPETVREGDKVYVVTEYLDRYFKDIHPKISNQYVLVTGRCDRGVDSKIVEKIDDKIIHWFSSNVEVDHPKVDSIPLGLQNRHWRIFDHPQSDINLFDEVRAEEHEKSNEVLMTFQIHTNAPERKKVHDFFANKAFVKHRKYNNKERVDREFVKDYFREIKRSKFVICPFGGGFDCHRNWEVFSLGSYPIIKKHKSMEAFYDMPAWFVDDWSQVNEVTIEQKYQELERNTQKTEKIWFDYWHDKIQKASGK